MNKPEMIASVAELGEMTKKAAEKAVDAVLKTIEIALAKGEDVKIVGHGTYSVKHKKSRKGRNPQTGEDIQIDAHNVPVFKAGKDLRDAVENVVIPEKVKGEFRGKKKEVVE